MISIKLLYFWLILINRLGASPNYETNQEWLTDPQINT